MLISFTKYALGLFALSAVSVKKSSAQTAAPGVSTVPPTSPPVDAGWGGCVDPRSNDEELVELGKQTTICITLSSSAEWNVPPPATARTLRLSFRPVADEFSRFHVLSSYKDLIEDQSTQVFDGSGNVTIHVASQKVLSFQRMFYSQSGGVGRIFPHLTAIIDVKKGVVNGITWDDACLFCSDDKCLENTYDFNGNLGTQSEYKQPVRGNGSRLAVDSHWSNFANLETFLSPSFKNPCLFQPALS